MIAQTTGVDARRYEVVAQCVHLEKRRELGRVAIVEGVDALGHRRASRRLDGDAARLLALLDVLTDERECDPGEVGAAADASHHEVGVRVGQFHLRQALLADDGLLKCHMIQYRAQGVVRVVALHGYFHGLADSHTQASRAVGVQRQHGPPTFGGIRGAGDDFRTPHADHAPAVWFLEIRDLHHVDEALHAQKLAGER